MLMTNKIRAMFIFEILGRPAEHIKETLSQLVDKLGEFPGIKIDKKKVHEAKPVEQEGVKDLFTTFAEVEILGDNIDAITNIVFNAMPSHVEIIEPDELTIKNFDLSNFLSSLTVKLHRYDEIAKTITLERNFLVGKLKEMQEKLGVSGTKEEVKEIKEIKEIKEEKSKKEKSKKKR